MTGRKIREMSEGEVRQHLDDREEELTNLKLRLVTHQLENPLTIRGVRRDIARLRTALREHELGLRPLTGSRPDGPAHSEESA
jgi:large subunit ribosomal protein L29